MPPIHQSDKSCRYANLRSPDICVGRSLNVTNFVVLYYHHSLLCYCGSTYKQKLSHKTHESKVQKLLKVQKTRPLSCWKFDKQHIWNRFCKS